MIPAFTTIVVGGIKVGVLTRREWVEYVVRHCKSRREDGLRPQVIFAANGQVVAHFALDPTFRAVFEQADAVTADGQPLVWASRLTRHPIPERTATTDLFHDIARAAEADRLTFFLLGSSERTNAMAEASMRQTYPALRIVGRQHGYFEVADEKEIAETVGAAEPDVLWVGLGMMKQAEFVIRNLSRLQGVGCVVTCGGLFDYFTPEVARAPAWMQDMALEWLFRTWQQPRKYLWRYFITNPVAAFLLLTQTRAS